MKIKDLVKIKLIDRADYERYEPNVASAINKERKRISNQAITDFHKEE